MFLVVARWGLKRVMSTGAMGANTPKLNTGVAVSSPPAVCKSPNVVSILE